MPLGAANPLNLPPGEFVCLAISDAGEGMDSATMARASEPFFTTKEPGHGTGLGLSVVHGLAEQSGGRLRLKSQLSMGTTAEIWLPVAEGNVTPEEAPAEGEDDQNQMVILAVDDDALVLMNTEAMIEELGHVPVTSSSAKEALEVLRSRQVDLVITDQAMPRMTGAELAEVIRAEWPRLPIVLATGYAELSDAPAGLRKLNKPFTQGQLAQIIADAIKTSGDTPK
jgi:CheY-like chemotaxis protein